MRFFLLIGFLLLSIGVFAQRIGDSLPRRDSPVRRDSLGLANSLPISDSLRRIDSLAADSLSRVAPPVRDTLRPALQFPFSSDSFRYRKQLFYSFTNPVRYTISEKKWESKEAVFYAIVALLLFFALVKNGSSRYLGDLFSAYFRTTVRQKQIKEQLAQSPLPSLLFNLFFVLSGGLFIALLVQRFGYGSHLPFALLALYGAAGLALIYLGKFLLLKFLGWIFQLREVTDTYIFIVFSTNKILGIFLLPFTVMLAFTYGSFNTTALTLSVVVVLGLFLYRFFLAIISVSHTLRLNLFHFLLYLAAFEVIPLLLINKVLFLFLREIA